MSLQQSIREQIKESMKAHDAVRTEVLRGISSACTNELVAKGRKPTDELADDETLAVISRLVKQRKDSIEQFKNGGREDLVAEESAQLAILQTFMPAQMSREEIETFVRAKKDELGISDKAQIGKFVGVIMKDLKGRADGNEVKSVVEGLFS